MILGAGRPLGTRLVQKSSRLQLSYFQLFVMKAVKAK